MNILEEIKTSEAARKRVAEHCRASFFAYIAIVWMANNNTKFTLKPFHRLIIDKLQCIVEQKNTKRNLCLNLPVGSGKSIIVELFVTWCFSRSINQTFCYISHSDRLITKLSKETKDIIESEVWQLLFQSSLKKDERAKVNYSFEGANNRTGLTAGTMGGAITGLDAGNPNTGGFSGALIIDDPIDIGNMRYPAAREECTVHYTDKLSTRRRTPDTPSILVMQRGHLEDLTGWIEANEPEDWDIVKIPALDENGESFWVERYPLSELEKEARINPYKFHAQYQQKPINAGGSVIKSEWFNYYTSLESIKPYKVFITGDTAQKTKEWNDYSVFTVWAADNNLYLLDMFRGKWEAPELLKEAKNVWDKWKQGINKKVCSAMYIEDKSSGTGLIQTMRRETNAPIIAVERSTDKLTRVEEILHYIESGRVFLPHSSDYSFNKDLISECEAFSRDMSHKHDDIIDTMCDAINKSLVGNNSSICNNPESYIVGA